MLDESRHRVKQVRGGQSAPCYPRRGSLVLLLATAIATSTALAETDTERLRASADTAAEIGQCEHVAAIGQRVQALDPDYYAMVFAVDPALAACLATPMPPPVESPRPTGDRLNPWTAILASAIPTVAGIAFAIAADTPHHYQLGYVAAPLILVGPTVGHIYAQQPWSAALGVRLAAVGSGLIGGLMVTFSCLDTCGDGKGERDGLILLGASAFVYTVASIYEIATAGRAAERTNRERGYDVVVAPMVMTHTVGAGLAVRF